eukprot:5984828-Lingulodinium_polyedra.AAC.1
MSGQRLANGWPTAGPWLANDRPMTGQRLANDTSTANRKLAVVWLLAGPRLPSTGDRLAIGWSLTGH